MKALLLFLPAIVFAAGGLLNQANVTAQDKTSYQKNGLKLTVKIPDSVQPGSEFELGLNLIVPDGFHVYGSRDQTYPTKIEIAENAAFKIGEAKIPGGSTHSKDDGSANYWLEGRRKIKQVIQVADSATGEIKITGTLDFMICDARSCMPPAKIEFEVSTNVVASSDLKLADESAMASKPEAAKAGTDQTLEEFKKYVAEKIQGLEDDQLAAIAKAVDSDSNGTISKSEFENRFEAIRAAMKPGAADNSSDEPDSKNKMPKTVDAAGNTNAESQPTATTKPTTGSSKFKQPVRMLADGKPVRAEAPGYASPTMADMNGDGRKDLLVGQYKDGKIKVYAALSNNKFGKGNWLQTDGVDAVVPGIW